MRAAKYRIAVVNSHPIQYFAPLYAYLSSSPDIEITAIYLSDFSVRGAPDNGFGRVVKWDIDLLTGYEHRFVRAAKENNAPSGFASVIAPDIWGLVRSGRFDALWLHGHNLGAYHVALAAAKMFGMATFMRCETHLGLSRKGVKAALRKPIIGTFYKAFDGFLAIGSMNRSFYLAMGVPVEKISIVPYAVDNDRITTAAALSPDERAEMRRRLGIPGDRPAVLYASKFQRRKHPDDLIRAAQKLAREGLEFDLVIVGSGEMDAELTAMVAVGGPARTVFPGFINQQELPRIFAACDIFVLPAEDEPWGLIVNEAMCAGLPIVVGSKVGCVPDLLDEGRNGTSFKARDVDGLAAALRPIISDPSRRASMSARSREIINSWSYKQCLDGLRQQIARLKAERRFGAVAPASH